jgi:hypothetical protein
MIDSMLLICYPDKRIINKENTGQEMGDESSGERDIAVMMAAEKEILEESS